MKTTREIDHAYTRFGELGGRKVEIQARSSLYFQRVNCEKKKKAPMSDLR